MNVDLNSSMFTDRNKSPEVDEVEAEDSDVEKVYEVKEEDVENKNSTEFGTLIYARESFVNILLKCF